VHEKEAIAQRYLKFQTSLVRQALARLVENEEDESSSDEQQQAEDVLEKPFSLNDQRLGAVMAALRSSGAKRVVDLGCGEGKLLRELLKDRQFAEILGMDVSIRSLEIAAKRLKIDNLSSFQAERIKLIHGSLMYRDKRLAGFDAAAVVEVIEHLDPPRLSAFERVVFQHAQPKTVVLTTPNAEYSVVWETLPAGMFRHSDHRFEWTRKEFQSWASGIGESYGYSVRFVLVGPEDDRVGPPTQMGVFTRE
jgi:3' terminal RNA ribose 2'-O-methyltransferase Hen1